MKIRFKETDVMQVSTFCYLMFGDLFSQCFPCRIHRQVGLSRDFMSFCVFADENRFFKSAQWPILPDFVSFFREMILIKVAHCNSYAFGTFEQVTWKIFALKSFDLKTICQPCL